MNVVEIITKKRDGNILSPEEIDFLIRGYTKGEIPDYQMAAFAMACYFKPLRNDEIFALTKSMIDSGSTIDFGKDFDFVVDKHSSGGVGDKTTLILGPLVSSFGITVAKMSGRGLGHTGGTLDKLESIPNFNVNLKIAEFQKQLKEINLGLMGQTKNLVPADKKLYSLRDVTATVPIPGLIASSIMSKKIAIHSDLIIIDMKCGDGAFMNDVHQARELSEMMNKIGESFNRKTIVLITNMNKPLGRAVGNMLEVEEAMKTLKNEGPEDITTLVIELAAIILCEAKKAENKDEAREKIKEQLKNGKAYKQFVTFVAKQGGQLDKMKFNPKFSHEVVASEPGYLHITSAKEIGIASMHLGAGRTKYTDPIDYQAGVYLHKKTGEEVMAGDKLFTLYSSQKINHEIIARIQEVFIIKKHVDKPILIYDLVEQRGKKWA